MQARILVVEDSATQAEALQSVLEENYDVTVARSGEAAFEELTRKGASYDLVLSDVMMPGITGYELCRRIREDPTMRRMPVVLLTSMGSPLDIIRGLEAGADNYITKPYEAEHLHQRLHHVLESNRVRRGLKTSMGVTVNFLGSELTITSDKEQILDLLLSSIEDVIRANQALEESQRQLAEAHAQLASHADRMEHAAHRSSERYASLMRSAGEAIFVLDADGRIQEVNPAATALLRTSAEELVGHELEGWMATDGRGLSTNDLLALDAARPTRSAERLLRTADGREVCCEVTVSSASVGEERLVMIIAHDITDRKDAEKRLEESEQHYASLFRYNPDAVYALDLAGRFISANPACLAMSGYEPERLIGTSFEALLVPEDLERVRDHFRRAAAGEPQNYRAAILHREGHRVELDVTNSPIIVGDEIRGVFGIAEDVSDARRAQERLRRSEEMLRALIHASPAAIVSVDAETRVQTWNPAAEELFGWMAEEVLDRRLPYVPADRRAEYEDIWEELREGKAVRALETRRRRKDGSEVEISISAAPLLSENGAVGGMVAIIGDVSERNRAQQALRDSEEQLRQAQKMEAVGRLAGGVAHDFNNILTAIKGNTQMLLMDAEDGDPAREELEEIHLAVERATNLTRQLLTFSRKEIVEPRSVDLNEVVRGVEKMLQRVLREDIRLRTELAADLPVVQTDPGHIEQVLMNLVVNARDAMPRGGSLSIATEAARSDEHGEGLGSAVLRVRDTGEGIPADIQPQVFEPFFTTKSKGQGTGLGLSTVFGIVQQWGGEITLRSREGEGTEFRIQLPAVGGTLPRRERSPETDPSQMGPMRVLLVEDEPQVRAVVRRMLERGGHSVVAVEGPRAALELCDTGDERYDLLISDVVMPGMNGPELVARIRGICAEIRVLFISGYSEDAISQHGVLDSGVDFIQKPFSMEMLHAKLASMSG